MDAVNWYTLSSQAPNKADTAMLGRHKDNDRNRKVRDKDRFWFRGRGLRMKPFVH
ncbi:MAG TPA: hypothetical protein VMH03_12295 [Terriglobales bacterium]|nr:hypothetical protein [Terriglobales bacterium]